MPVSKINSFSRGQIAGFGARIVIFTNNFPCKEFINRRAMHKFEISRRNERKPQPQVAWPAAMFIKDNHLKSQRLSESGVAKFLDLEHGWQFSSFPV